jgi:hypothetical protein
MNVIQVLFLAANPAGTRQLSLDREFRSIEIKIRASEHRDSLRLKSRWAVRPDDLLQAFNQDKPHIVHFSGHGSTSDEIILVDDRGNPRPVSTPALVNLFQTLRGNIRLVVLNACFSRPQARALTKVIDCVVGMSKSIGDEAAITFAAAFYRAIGFGLSVQQAFDQGKTAILLEGIPESHTPKLFVRDGIDPASVVFLVPQ